MSDETKRFLLYLCFELDQEDEGWKTLALASDRNEAEKWKNKSSDDDKTDAVAAHTPDDFKEKMREDEAERNSDTPADQLSQLMGRFRETMSGYGPLTGDLYA